MNVRRFPIRTLRSNTETPNIYKDNEIEKLKKQIAEVENDIIQKTNLFRQKSETNQKLIDTKELYLQNLTVAAMQRPDNDTIEKNNRLKKIFEDTNSITTDTRKIVETIDRNIRVYNKYLEDSQYIMKILPNETENVYDFAVKMIMHKFSQVVNQNETKILNLEAEIQDQEDEKETIEGILNQLTSENTGFENEIASLQTKIDQIENQMQFSKATQEKLKASNSQPLAELKRQISLIKHERKTLIKAEDRKNFKIFQELKEETSKLRVQSASKASEISNLRNQIQKLNNDIRTARMNALNQNRLDTLNRF